MQKLCILFDEEIRQNQRFLIGPINAGCRISASFPMSEFGLDSPVLVELNSMNYAEILHIATEWYFIKCLKDF